MLNPVIVNAKKDTNESGLNIQKDAGESGGSINVCEINKQAKVIYKEFESGILSGKDKG